MRNASSYRAVGRPKTLHRPEKPTGVERCVALGTYVLMERRSIDRDNETDRKEAKAKRQRGTDRHGQRNIYMERETECDRQTQGERYRDRHRATDCYTGKHGGTGKRKTQKYVRHR